MFVHYQQKSKAALLSLPIDYKNDFIYNDDSKFYICVNPKNSKWRTLQ